MAKQLVFSKNSSFVGWECKGCGWVAPLPRLSAGGGTPPKDVVEAFEAHVCKDVPEKPKREDFSQAAARIVGKATER